MWIVALCFVFLFDAGHGHLWRKGVVHYAINSKDYDLHSQDVIISTLSEIQKEICIKFFQTPMRYNASVDHNILYISNPDKRKTCPLDNYNFKNNIVDMVIGYKCVNQKDVTRIVVDMLKASITNEVLTINSNDLIRSFQAMDEDPSRPTLLTAKDRNFINAHYHTECGALSQRPAIDTRRFAGPLHMTKENEIYYRDKMWPLGIVMYGVEQKLRFSPDHTALKYAMTTVELATCVVFQEMQKEAVLKPKNFLWFASEGEEAPELGFKEGNQTISLVSMTNGAPGHTAHTLNLLLRTLGVPMMSNRYDRDNYIAINWKNVQKVHGKVTTLKPDVKHSVVQIKWQLSRHVAALDGCQYNAGLMLLDIHWLTPERDSPKRATMVGKERYLEKTPESAWLSDEEGGRTPYCFESATHAPANYMCGDCMLTANTVHPVQDHLWQRTLSMGHRTELASCDVEALNILYNKHCHNRYMANN